MDNARCVLLRRGERPSISKPSLALFAPKPFDLTDRRVPTNKRMTSARRYSQVQRGTRIVSRKQEVRM